MKKSTGMIVFLILFVNQLAWVVQAEWTKSGSVMDSIFFALSQLTWIIASLSICNCAANIKLKQDD